MCYVERLLKIWIVKPLSQFLCILSPFNVSEVNNISPVMNLSQAVYLQNNMEKGENSSFPEGISCSCILNVNVHHKENCLIYSLRPFIEHSAI